MVQHMKASKWGERSGDEVKAKANAKSKAKAKTKTKTKAKAKAKATLRRAATRLAARPLTLQPACATTNR
jgi:hypothetical protein